MLTPAQAIAQIKTTHGLNQQGLATKLGCSQATISNAKKGKAKLNTQQLEMLQQLAGQPVISDCGVVEAPQAPVEVETDEAMWKRIEESYEDLESVVRLVGSGKANSAIVSGGSGLGKTYTIEKTLQESGVVYKKIAGSGSASQLYRQLFENQDELLLLDDADAMVMDEESLNILKAALDTGAEKRMVSWMKQNRSFEADDIPNQFQFKGQVIVITNLKLEGSSKLAAHFDAVASRSLVFDMKMDSRKEVFCRLRQLAPVILSSFDDLEREEILGFFDKNLDKFKRLSIREMAKFAELYGVDNWERLCTRIFLK